MQESASTKRKVAFVTFVIGKKYVAKFNRYFKKSLQAYCDKYDYELIILDKWLTEDPEKHPKKFFWQRLLIPNFFQEYDFVISIDSDIFVNPDSPPIPFDSIPDGKVAAINERKYLGNYEWREAAQRKRGFEITGREWHAKSGVIRPYNDHINGGLVIYQPRHHAEMMLQLYNDNIQDFMNYHQDDQSVLSPFLIDNDLIFWLDERFNRIWGLWKRILYPGFSFYPPFLKRAIVRNYVRLNYFCHFTSGEDRRYLKGIRVD